VAPPRVASTAAVAAPFHNPNISAAPSTSGHVHAGPPATLMLADNDRAPPTAAARRTDVSTRARRVAVPTHYIQAASAAAARVAATPVGAGTTPPPTTGTDGGRPGCAMTSALPARRFDPNRTATASVATPSGVRAAGPPSHARGRMPLRLKTARLASPAPASVDPAGAKETTSARAMAPPRIVCGHALPEQEPQRFSCS